MTLESRHTHLTRPKEQHGLASLRVSARPGRFRQLAVRAIAATLALFTLACASSAKVGLLTPIPPAPATSLRVAVSPAVFSGALARRIGQRLSDRGVSVVSRSDTLDLLTRHDIPRAEAASPHGLRALHEQGIDILLIVDAVNGWDSKPDSAAARLLSTVTGDVLMAVSWENGHCAMKGSPCDRRNRMVTDFAAAHMVPLLERALLAGVNGSQGLQGHSGP